MAAKDEPISCEYCNKGRVIKRMERIAFRQWSDKGYVHCRVMTLVGCCNNCDAKFYDAECDKAFEETFKREYRKLSA